MDKYQIEAEKLILLIDIGSESDAHSYANGMMGKKQLEIRRTFNTKAKELVINPDKKSRNIDSLNEIKAEFLRYYYSSKTDDANYFWNRVKESNLDYERVDMRGLSDWELKTKEIQMLRGSNKYRMDKYQIEAEKLAKATDIAQEATKLRHTNGLIADNELKIMMDAYTLWKHMALYPERKFRKISILKYLINDTLSYFQEATGEDVEYFWNKIKEHNLGYERVDLLAKILKKKRITNRFEYDFINDNVVVFHQTGKTTEAEDILLKKWLGNYEMKGYDR